MESTHRRTNSKSATPARLRKVAAGYTAIPNAVLQDRRLTYRARGVLAYLLSKPDGWDVRADVIAAESPGEHRGHVRGALRELGALGYYRIVRQQRPDGPGGRLIWTTETWVSQTPAVMWAQEWGARNGRPVLLRHARPDPAAPPAGAGAGAGVAAPLMPAPACDVHGHEHAVLTTTGECTMCRAERIAAL